MKNTQTILPCLHLLNEFAMCKLLKRFIKPALLITACIASPSLYAASEVVWALDGAKSNIQYVSTRNTHDSEVNSFATGVDGSNALNGSIDTSGNAILSIDLNDVETGVSTRNERILNFVFETEFLPTAYINIDLDLDTISSMSVGSSRTQTISGSLILHGVSQEVETDVIITKTSNTDMQVSTLRPILIDSNDFEFSSGIEVLRGLANLASIGEAVPVYFRLHYDANTDDRALPIAIGEAPAEPSNLDGDYDSASTTSALSWQDNSSNESGFIVRRKQGETGAWSTVANVGEDVSRYSDVLDQSGEFDYRVIAVNASVPSRPSNILNLIAVDSAPVDPAPVDPAPVDPDPVDPDPVDPDPVDPDPVDPNPVDPNPVASGQELYNAQCSSCHGSEAEGVGPFPALNTPRDVETMIDVTASLMPLTNPASCDQQCAEEISDYIQTFWSSEPTGPEVSQCVPGEAVSSPIRRITEMEYDNAVEALLGVSMHGTTNLEIDSQNGPFATNRGTPASSAAVLNYFDSAELIASLVTNGSDYRNNWVLNSTNSQLDLRNAIDGDLSTRWATNEAQEPNQSFAIDLGFVQRFDRIVLSHQGRTDDFPAAYEVAISTDGINWGEPISTGRGSAPETVINFDPIDARHIRILQTGSTDRFWWSIQELNVLLDGSVISPVTDVISCNSLDCAETFIESFARRAYRRSLTQDEQSTLLSFINTADTVTDGIQRAIERVLQSPEFIYQVERSIDGSGSGNMERLTGLSIAEKLASFLWNSIPDDELLDAAEAGELDTNQGVEEQAERMINDPRATDAFANFVEQWFNTKLITETQKDPEVYPEFDDNLAAAMREETVNFVKWMVENDRFTLQELLTSSKAFPGETLADLYNVSPQSNNDPIDLEGRVGILTHPSITASHANLADTAVVSRGNFMLQTVLCNMLPDPPANVEALLGELDDSLPIRERLAEHTQNESCQACHSLIDPLGSSLESYGPIGELRDTDVLGFPVETHGTLIGTDQDGDFADITGLMSRITSSNTGANCAVTQWMRFAQRRQIASEDQCSIDTVTQEFENSDYNFNELVRAITTSNSFLYRDSTGDDR